MPNYGFEATRGSNGQPIMGVTITHNPAVCIANGLACTAPAMTTNTRPSALATMNVPGDIPHYFTATYPGQPNVVENQYTLGMNQARYIEFVFPGL